MQSKLTGASVSIVGQDLLTSTATQAHNLGSYAETVDGRGFRYALIGAVSTVPGKLYQASASDATNLTPTGGLGVSAAVAAGGTQVTISTSTTVAANLLANGYLITDVTPGQGYILGIKGNTATAAAAGLVINLDDAVPVALTTASKVVLAQHPYANVVVYPTTATGIAAGVSTQAIITNAQYGWLQTHGICGILSGVATSITAGVPVAPSTATAGAVVVSTAVLPTIGWAMHTFTATEYQFVFLTIN